MMEVVLVEGQVEVMEMSTTKTVRFTMPACIDRIAVINPK